MQLRNRTSRTGESKSQLTELNNLVWFGSLSARFHSDSMCSLYVSRNADPRQQASGHRRALQFLEKRAAPPPKQAATRVGPGQTRIRAKARAKLTCPPCVRSFASARFFQTDTFSFNTSECSPDFAFLKRRNTLLSAS